MPRTARLVIPGLPHHIVQRGNRRLPTFFSDEDYRLYRQLLAERCARWQVSIWAYCLMPNHVHLIAVPATELGLAGAFGEAHREYTKRLNAREGLTGCLWQGRYGSHALDEAHLYTAARYVELNPLRAGLVQELAEWPWSSAAAHLSGQDDELVTAAPLLERWPDWAAVLQQAVNAEDELALRRHTRSGRPWATAETLAELAARYGERVRARPVGRPRRRRD